MNELAKTMTREEMVMVADEMERRAAIIRRIAGKVSLASFPALRFRNN